MHFCLALFFCIHGELKAQEYPKTALFQVLNAKNTRYANGAALNDFDFLFAKDTIVIPEGESLFLVHRSGLTLSYVDTTLAIKKLDKLIWPDEGNTEVYPFNSRQSRNFDILRLKDSLRWDEIKGYRAEYFKATITGSVCGSEKIIPTCPVTFNYRIYTTGDVVLRLDCSETVRDTLFVTGASLEGDDLFSTTLVGAEFRLDSVYVIAYLQEFEQFTIGYQSMYDNIAGAYLVERLPYDVKIAYLNCDSQDPDVNVMLGFYNEFIEPSLLPCAESYYLKASQLSDDSFYLEVLDSFRERQMN